MAKNKKETTPDGLSSVENTLSKTEQYVESNYKSLSIILLAIIVIIAGYTAYAKYIVEPKDAKAVEEMYTAEFYFEKDSFELALEGDDENLGFLNIIETYGSSKAGNLANYYAGVCYLRLGEFETAIEYLSNFSSDDVMLAPIAIGSIGDANLELGNIDDAISYYEKAADVSENAFTSPIYLLKAGTLYEEKGSADKAIELYEKIKNDYPKSDEARQMDKYITKAKISK